jgi:MoxR-like ATPase
MAEIVVSPVFDLAQRLRGSVGEAVVGKESALNLVLVALLCNGHILVEDIPGVGKTTLARALSSSLGLIFKRIQFTPDLTPVDVVGTNIFNQKTTGFDFYPGPVFTQILLADEINRATPRTQSALLEAMQESQVTIDGVTRSLPTPFLVVATQNPIELEGTFPLPEAQIDRFMLRIRLGYPSLDDELEILRRYQVQSGPVTPVGPSVPLQDLLASQRLVEAVNVEASVAEYLVKVVRETRNHKSLELGASPRAALFLYRGAKALAAVSDRAYVLPDDVKILAEPILAHRLVLAPQARLRGHTVEQVIVDVLDSVPVPVES